jgi:hypothetical protein
MATKKQSPFTEAEQVIIRRHAYRVWEYCGGDVLQAIAEDTGKDINRVTVSRAVAIEIALDADRCTESMRRDKEVTPDLLKRVHDCDYPTLIKVVKPAFTYSRYGM